MAYLARDVAVVFGLAAGAYAVNSWCACPALRAQCPVPRPGAAVPFAGKAWGKAAVRLLCCREG